MRADWDYDDSIVVVNRISKACTDTKVAYSLRVVCLLRTLLGQYYQTCSKQFLQFWLTLKTSTLGSHKNFDI